MSVSFKVKMTPQAMYSFMLHHHYTHLPGILGVIFGAVIFSVGLGQIETGSLSGGGFMFLLTVLVMAYPPAMLWIRAKRQVEAVPSFRHMMYYELTDSGVRVIQGENENENPWSDFKNAVSTGQALVLYMEKTKAVIFPRTQIGERWAAVTEMVSTHMPPDKVHIRQVN